MWGGLVVGIARVGKHRRAPMTRQCHLGLKAVGAQVLAANHPAVNVAGPERTVGVTANALVAAGKKPFGQRKRAELIDITCALLGAKQQAAPRTQRQHGAIIVL